MNNSKLAKKIVDCLSDGYDDEENREEAERALCNDLSQLKEDSIVKAAILRMCETIEELEQILRDENLSRKNATALWVQVKKLKQVQQLTEEALIESTE